jgi:hypothetical protein
VLRFEESDSSLEMSHPSDDSTPCFEKHRSHVCSNFTTLVIALIVIRMKDQLYTAAKVNIISISIIQEGLETLVNDCHRGELTESSIESYQK